MCNDPVSKIYLSEILLPFDAIVMALFDNVEGKHNQCAVGSLYNSATLFKAAYNNEKKLLTNGIIIVRVRVLRFVNNNFIHVLFIS